jgi:hypothetical protein
MEACAGLLRGLGSLRHLLLLRVFRRLGAGHVVEGGADTGLIVRTHLLEMGELALRNFPSESSTSLRNKKGGLSAALSQQ